MSTKKYHVTTMTAAKLAAQRRAIAINYAVRQRAEEAARFRRPLRTVYDIDDTAMRVEKERDLSDRALAKRIADNKSHAKYLKALAYKRKHPTKFVLPDKGWMILDDQWYDSNRINKNRAAAQRRLAATRARKQPMTRNVSYYKRK